MRFKVMEGMLPKDIDQSEQQYISKKVIAWRANWRQGTLQGGLISCKLEDGTTQGEGMLYRDDFETFLGMLNSGRVVYYSHERNIFEVRSDNWDDV